MKQRLIWLGIFVGAFAYIESSIVVYLREIYFPEGFSFPFLLEPDRLAGIELGRELCTILILWAAGTFMGRDGWESIPLARLAHETVRVRHHFAKGPSADTSP